VNALVATLLVRMGASMPADRRGGPATGARLEKLLHPSLHWLLVVVVLVALAFLTMTLSMMAWTDTHRHQDIRSVGRGAAH
jgi:hypothetical protein